MTTRLDWASLAPEARKALVALEVHVRKGSGLQHNLIDLVYLRVSQINGCGYCVDQHSHDLLAHGETPQRLAMVAAFEEGEEVFTEQERAALAWAEACTRLSDAHVSDAVFERAHRHFDDHQLAELSVAIATINAWNRLGAPLRITVKKR